VSHSSVWNSFEVVELVVSVMTPVAVALLGVLVTRATRRAEETVAAAARAAEDAQWANRRAVERLIELHKEMAPLLNDLICFFRQIGHFREIDPPEALVRKRRLDRIFYANEHLFGPEFRTRYPSFMHLCFAMWKSAGADAKIRTSADRLRGERGESVPWNGEWDKLFDNAAGSGNLRREQTAAYEAVMSAFADELGLLRQNSRSST
jgi:hypothetical protein